MGTAGSGANEARVFVLSLKTWMVLPLEFSIIFLIYLDSNRLPATCVVQRHLWRALFCPVLCF